MNRAEKKQKAKAAKRERKRQSMASHGGKSKYARKKAWLNSHTRIEMMPVATREPKRDDDGNVVVHDGRAVYVDVTRMEEVRRYMWGFEVPQPKPWM